MAKGGLSPLQKGEDSLPEKKGRGGEMLIVDAQVVTASYGQLEKKRGRHPSPFNRSHRKKRGEECRARIRVLLRGKRKAKSAPLAAHINFSIKGKKKKKGENGCLTRDNSGIAGTPRERKGSARYLFALTKKKKAGYRVA